MCHACDRLGVGGRGRKVQVCVPGMVMVSL